MLIPFDHKKYVEVGIWQLHLKLSCHYFFHKNQHLKYQAFPKASWQHDQYILSWNHCRNCFFWFQFFCTRHIKLWKTLKCFLKRGFETYNCTISVSHHSLWMMPKWHIWLVIDSWSLTTPIRNSVGWTEFWKIAMTLGRCNLHSLTHNPLLLFTVDHPLGTNLFSLQPSAAIKIKDGSYIIFIKKILSNCSPKLHLLCRLPWFWPYNAVSVYCLQPHMLSVLICNLLLIFSPIKT